MGTASNYRVYIMLPLLLIAAMFSSEVTHQVQHQQKESLRHQAFDVKGWLKDTSAASGYRFFGTELEMEYGTENMQVSDAHLAIFQENGDTWYARADQALLQGEEQTILLQGNVAISYGTNHCLRTENVLLQQQQNRVIVNSRLRESFIPGDPADVPGSGYYACDRADTDYRQPG